MYLKGKSHDLRHSFVTLSDLSAKGLDPVGTANLLKDLCLRRFLVELIMGYLFFFVFLKRSNIFKQKTWQSQYHFNNVYFCFYPASWQWLWCFCAGWHHHADFEGWRGHLPWLRALRDALLSSCSPFTSKRDLTSRRLVGWGIFIYYCWHRAFFFGGGGGERGLFIHLKI